MNVGFDASELLGPVEELEARGANVAAIMPRAANILVEAVDTEFYTEGRGRWKKSQRAEREGGKTLNDTGLLADVQPRYGADFAQAYTDVPYGKYHLPPEKSGHASKGIMPVRDFLDIDMDQAASDIADLFLAEAVG